MAVSCELSAGHSAIIPPLSWRFGWSPLYKIPSCDIASLGRPWMELGADADVTQIQSGVQTAGASVEARP